MKSRFLTLLAAAAMMLAVLIQNAAARDLKAEHLFHRLQQLPAGAARPTLVVKLLKALVRSHPMLAYKYYRVAITRLDSTGVTSSATVTKLAILVLKLMKTAGLSTAQINRFSRHIPGLYGEPGWNNPPPPTPTPGPTP